MPRMNLQRLQVLVRHMRTMSSAATAVQEDVLLHTINGKGVITLNRPKALNSLNLNMIRKMYPKLKEWDSDSKTSLVIIQGAGGKAFCAGGDIKAIVDKQQPEFGVNFFREEYILNHKIATMKTPFIALVNGISMGGGVGLSIHGKYRVATEKTVFAMPETGIGLFPDVGGGYVLPRLKGQLGIYLALTGFRLKGRDVLHAGYATHFVESSKIADLTKSLIELQNPSAEDVDETVQRFHKECQLDKDEPFVLQSHQQQIDRLFAGNTMEEICDALQNEGSDWAAKQLEILRKMSPTSLKVSLRQMREGANLDIVTNFKSEYRISQGCMRGNDFHEGVRALLLDKDGSPKWKPATLEEVTPDIVDDHFKPVDNDLYL